jgi:hypothetical protein
LIGKKRMLENFVFGFPSSHLTMLVLLFQIKSGVAASQLMKIKDFLIFNESKSTNFSEECAHRKFVLRKKLTKVFFCTYSEGNVDKV